VAQARPAAEAKGLSLTLEMDAGVPKKLCSDPRRLRQVLAQLLDNAVKFTERGSIRLIASLGNEGGRPPSSETVLLDLGVVDTGIGIAPEAQRTIFEAFSQADSGPNRRRGGAGLGLTVATKLVASLQGELRLVSTLGRGSAFHVRVPTTAVPVTPSPES
jgi:signal transduction histidine kinase